MFSFCHNFCCLRDERFANRENLTDYWSRKQVRLLSLRRFMFI